MMFAYMAFWLRSRLRALAGPALLFAISVCFCWRLVLTDQYTWLESPDLAFQVLPWFQFQAGEWHQGHFPMWDPYHWLGQPLIGQMITAAACPLNWILFLLPLKHGWIRQAAMHWYFVLLHFLAALSMYALCRDLKRSRWASIVGACVFAFGGFIGTNDWPCMLAGGIWMPLVFLYLLRATRGVRPLPSAALSGMFLGLSWLSGHHQVPLFVTLTVAGTWTYFIFRPGRPDWRLIRLGAASAVIMILVSALQTLPGYEYGKLAKRWAGLPDPLAWDQKVPYMVHADNSFTPDSIIGIVLPGIHKHADGYMGAIAVALAILAIWVWRSKEIVQIASAICLAGLLVAMGSFTLVHGVLYSVVPMVEKARSPCMAIIVFNFGIALLCAYGIDAYRSWEYQFPVWRIGAGLLAFGFVLFLIGAVLLVANKGLYNDRAMTTALLSCIAGGILIWAPSGRLFAAVIGLMIFCELSQVFGYLEPNRYEKERNPYLPKMAEGSEIVEFLRSRPEPVRVDVDDKVYPHNFGDWYGVEQLSGYLASLTANMTYMETHRQRSQQLFGVNYYIGTAAKFQGQEVLMELPNGVKLFRNPDVFPRAWVVHRLTKVQARPYTTTFISNTENDLRNTASLLDDPPALEHCAGDDAYLQSHAAARVQITVDAKCRGMLILSDTYYPGWRATVDGRPAKIWEAYGVIRGVVVEKGSHVVNMVYRPASVIWGGILTAIGFVLSLAVQLIPARYLPS